MFKRKNKDRVIVLHAEVGNLKGVELKKALLEQGDMLRDSLKITGIESQVIVLPKRNGISSHLEIIN
jgi:hypothetical protein